MSVECSSLHLLFNNLKRFRYPIDVSQIPLNGLYVLFEEGEKGHNSDRIVRVGAHTGKDKLCSRLKEHFQNKNKDRSIFRKNIGRALLQKNDDTYLENWELDLTTRIAKERYAHTIDFDYQQGIEESVSEVIQSNFSFAVIEIEDKAERLETESKIISTVSLCEECNSSENWLGRFSPKDKIVESGLWLVNGLYKTPFTMLEIDHLEAP